MILKHKNNFIKIILRVYFIVAAVEIITEYFKYKPLLFIFQPLIPIVLMILYWNTSHKRNLLFFITIFFALITDVFFIPNTEKMLFFGIITFTIHRLLAIFYIVKLTKIRDCIPLLISIIPFLFIFTYLLSIANEMPKISFDVFIIQIILISLLGGIALSSYVMDANKRNTWLIIFGLLSVAHSFIVFIEKWYLSNLAPSVFRPLAMILITAIYYSFYKFVIGTENLADN